MADDSGGSPAGDLDLARAFISADDAAFDALYRRYARPVHDYALGIVRDRSLAEDVTQTTFLRAYEQRASIRDPASVRAWLYRIAHNVAVNQVTRTMRTEEIPDDAPLAASESGPERVAEQAEAVRLVWDAAASLEPRQFTVLDLALRKGLSSAEIGVVLDLDATQASLALHRAREALGNAVRFLVVARRRRHCDRLAELVPAGVRSLSPEQRASVDRHVRRCSSCQRTALALTAPGGLFGAIPIAVLPAALLGWRAAPSAAAPVAYQVPAKHEFPRPAAHRAARRLLVAGGAVAVLATAVVVVKTANHPEPSRRILAQVATTSPAPPAAAALSGRIVFGTGTSGRRAFGAANPDGSHSRQLPIGGPTCCYAASFSPDGSRLLFAGEGVIHVAAADSTGDRVVWASPTALVSALAWSPDGRHIAFSASSDVTPGPPRSVIYTVDTDGSVERRICQGLNVHALAWSPDGAQLAFLQNQGNIWAVPATGGPIRVLFGPAQGELPNELPDNLSWTPGDALLFSEIGAQPDGVWLVNADGTGARLILAGAKSPSWGPDGRHFAAALNGRAVIATVAGAVPTSIGPPGVQVVT